MSPISSKTSNQLLMLPGPTNVSTRVMNSMLKPIISHRSPEFQSLLTNIEDKLRQIFVTKHHVTTLSMSGTGAVEAVFQTFFKNGDKILFPMFGEFCQRPADNAEMLGLNPIPIYSEIGYGPDIEKIKEAIDLIPDLTSMFIPLNETSTGISPSHLKKIISICKKQDLLIIVDAVSGLAGHTLNMDEWGIDVCIAGSQKCIAAPPGLSMVAVNSKALEKSKQIPKISRHSDVSLNIEWLKTKSETPFTPAIPLFYALNEALSEILEEGLKNRIERHSLCASAIYKAMEQIPFELLVKDENRSNTVIAVKYPKGINDETFRSELLKKHNVDIAGGAANLKDKIFRIGSLGSVSPENVPKTVTGISDIMNIMGTKHGCDINVKDIINETKHNLGLFN